MLARAYRVTDKLGLALLRLLAVSFDMVVAWGAGLAQLLQGALWLVGSLAWRVLRLLLQGLMQALRLVGILGRPVRQAASGAAGAPGGIMARRAARAQVQAATPEDPLRVQNRLLSVLTIGLLAALVGVVLWATGPARQAGQPVAGGPAGGSGLFSASVGTPVMTNPPALLSTPVPTSTPLPSVLEARGSIAFSARENGQLDIWGLNIGSRSPVRLVSSPQDDRDPAWSPDGQRLAYASRQDGNWELYVYDVASGTSTRLTYDLSFQGAPHWSPDGLFLVYESYQGGNLDIYVAPVDGQGQAQRVTDHPTPDFWPAWSPDGRRIAFVSWRGGNQDIFVFSLDNPSDAASINLTQTPTRQEDLPAWSPDGRYLAYSALEDGIEKVFVKPSDTPSAEALVIAQGHSPSWSPDGRSILYAVDSLEGTQFIASPFSDLGLPTIVVGARGEGSSPVWNSLPLPTALINSGGLPSGAPQPLFVEQVSRPDRDGLFGLQPLRGVEVLRSTAYLSDRVDDSFNALRGRALQATGWDFLGAIDDAFWSLTQLPQPGEERRNWYMVGRAFGVNRNLTAGFPPQIELVREDIGIETRWRLFVRVVEEAQDGQLGEPLRRMPWDMLSRSSGDVQAYDEGGRLRDQVPAGYYVDFTEVARDFGWLPAPTGSDWRANFNSINYWLFRKTDNLSWYEGMREIYTEAQLGGFAPTATPSPAGSS